MKRVLKQAMLVWCCLTGLSAAQAGEVQVAVAANFAGPFNKIAAVFQAETGHTTKVSVGSTGKFHTQIKEGAPFEVLLAADQDTPRKLEEEGLSIKGQTFTYAKGKLVLWSAKEGFVDDKGAVLKKGGFAHLALANPKLAPYGAAGVEALKALNLTDALAPKMVQGDNIAQTFQFIATGNAELGFVALSQVAAPDKPAGGSYWLVPAKLYTPILQDATLLKKGEGNAAAAALLKFLKGDKAHIIIKAFGYEL
ncbi:MAG: molybdate ABC transporter substrate-binding protein [Aquabacterium sp.]|uniref:molybdate ABC transporter substrate-binding protein n=1 Tax=Aquabacterium sp. TaxID=1872578 RepID=UPI0011FFC626|nr:molybdate ABC transporter substrate-binding protein [Aquabacterium sp.]TAK98070.1 MAG: molybdate ABC transporter substrate-binding protein [Aquabacterium sp.]